MKSQNILKFCMENGFLIESSALDLLDCIPDDDSVKMAINILGKNTCNKMITRGLFENNKNKLDTFISELPAEQQENFKKLKEKLGMDENNLVENSLHYGETPKNETRRGNVKVLSEVPPLKPKLEVKDFVKNLKNRFNEIKNMLQDRNELENLVSIDKLSGKGQKSSIIGIVSEKQVTKNKNFILEVEDLTGKTKILISKNRPEIYEEAENIALDSVLGFVGSGDRNMFFVNEIIFPDVPISDKKYSNVEEYALFIADIHYGSKLFLKDNFLKFIDYLNGATGDKEVEKIKYLIIAGDIVAGIGTYPTQFYDLDVTDLEEQFKGLAEMLGKIRKDITIIISPGNHDGVRLMEPQPPLDEKYAWPLYDLENVVLVSNPAYINIGSNEGFSGYDILVYHGFSYPFYANNIPCLIEKGLSAPDRIMNYLLKNRHLAPSNSSTQYFPSDKDELLIRKIPDIFFSGHIHKLALDFYKGVLVICSATWEQETELIKKYGNLIDLCKVPMFNLKTRKIKILDFE